MAEPKAISVDVSKPYALVTWDERGSCVVNIGGGIAHDHLIVASFMLGRQANDFITDMMVRQAMARDGEGIVPFATIPDAMKRGT